MRTSRRAWLAVLAGAVASPPLAALAQQGGRRRGAAGATNTMPPPLPRDAAEKQALDVLDDIDKRQSYLNVSRDDGRLLRTTAHAMAAKRVIEIGTSTGYSGIWLALALRATGGRLTTFEIDAPRADIARANFKRAGLADIADVITADAHREVGKISGPLDLVFIDADKDGYLEYLQKLLPQVRAGGLVVADNMRVPAPDPAYIKAVTTDAALETVFVNMSGTGMAFSLKKS